jgi:hypothetical protein
MKLGISEAGRRVIVATALGIVVAGAAVGLLEIRDDENAPPPKMVAVMVAKSYLASQALVEPGCCYEKKIPQIYAPPRPLTRKDLGSGPARFRARGEILKGDILTAPRVIDSAAALSASWDILEHETALTLNLSPAGAMAGVLSPGDMVNVVAVFEKRACVLIPNARLMTTSKRGDAMASADEGLVTLAVDSRDGLRAMLAMQKAVLALSLVSPTPSRTPACVDMGDL